MKNNIPRLSRHTILGDTNILNLRCLWDIYVEISTEHCIRLDCLSRMQEIEVMDIHLGVICVKQKERVSKATQGGRSEEEHREEGQAGRHGRSFRYASGKVRLGLKCFHWIWQQGSH